MSMRIRQLSAAVANQIAAGEVIERPASVVKELLENAQDAKADSITIDVGYGGLNQIKISDNGMGIVADDLPLALAAHATSKITQLTDLYAISSMGFRGEALASIASVARVSISSKPASQDTGMMLDNQHHQITACARSAGTTIDVRDIFYNAPVRKKFLKPERSEFQAIDKVVRCFALGSPEISLNLSHNGKAVLHLPAARDEQSRVSRIAKVLGKSFVEQSLTLDHEHAGMRLHGWVSDPGLQRSQNDKIWVYLNGRMVKDKLINHAIKQAYDSVLHPGRFPSCLLYFSIDPGEVDVNVHPTKHEVRFQQPRLVHDFIRSQIQQRLQITADIDESLFEPLPQPFKQPSWVVRERDTSMDYHAPAPEPGQKTNPPLLLNERFAVFMIEKTPYLIDVLALQTQCLLDTLRNSARPLASRPLLVPMYLDTSPDLWQKAKACLHQLGIETDCAANGKIMIRSLPQQTPNVSIKSLVLAIMDQVQQGEPSEAQLLDLLVQHQMMDCQTLLNDPYNECLAWFKQKAAENDTQAFAKPLSLSFCQDVFHA